MSLKDRMPKINDPQDRMPKRPVPSSKNRNNCWVTFLVLVGAMAALYYIFFNTL